jgi:hypothetical protein
MPKPKYDHLRTLAFQFEPDTVTLPYQCEVMAFPEQWKPLLLDLAKEATGRSDKPVSIPIDSLNRALRALAPDLIHIARGAHKAGELPWLYSARKLDCNALCMIFHAWVHVAFAGASDARRCHVLSEISADALQWTTTTVNLANWHAGDNGTAEIAEPDAFKLLPHYLATLISDQNASFAIGNETRSFRRAPLDPGQNGAELISWPPIIYEDKQRNQWPFSIVLTVTLQTVPFQSFPVVHCDLGVRRWAGPKPYIPPMRRGQTSVYLLTETPWLRGFEHTHSFQVAPLARKKITNEDSLDAHYQIVWGRGGELAAILDQLSAHRQQGFPDPQHIVDDPLKALNVDSNPSAAIVYRHGMTPQHRVGSGLPPADRRAIAEQLKDFLAPMFRLTDAPSRVSSVPRATVHNPFFPSTAEKRSNEKMARLYTQCRAAIGRVCGGSLTVEIRYQRHDFVETMSRVIGEMLDMPVAPGQTCMTPELAITMNATHLGSLGEALNIDTSRKRKQDRLLAAHNERMDLIQAEMPPATSPTITLIELGGENSFEEGRDPKMALRLGFARTGRLTQFFALPKNNQEDEQADDKLEHRAKNGFLDGLRQLGVSVDLPQMKGLPTALNVVGLWFIQQNAPTNWTQGKTMLPVAVNLSVETGEIRATAPGLDESGWLSYPELLKAIAAGKAKSVEKPYHAMPFVQAIIQDITAEGATLLLCHAQNFRRVWPWIGNGKMIQDHLVFGRDSVQPISHWSGLRVVRIRDNQGNETPEWYAEHPDENMFDEAPGFSQGLFTMGERVFASTYQPPKTAPKKARSVSKFEEWVNTTGTKAPSPSYYAWNPGLFELTVAALQPDDTPELWAAFVHKLRQATLQYDAATALPLPLHLARGVQEYVLLTDEWSDDDESASTI